MLYAKGVWDKPQGTRGEAPEWAIRGFVARGWQLIPSHSKAYFAVLSRSSEADIVSLGQTCNNKSCLLRSYAWDFARNGKELTESFAVPA